MKRLLILLALFATTNAQAVTVDFDSDYTVDTSVITSKGFLFTPTDAFLGFGTSGNGTNAPIYSAPGCPFCSGTGVQVTTVGGADFNLESLEIAWGATLGFDATIFGSYGGGGSISRSITSGAWHLETFDSQWESLSSVAIFIDGIYLSDAVSIDNFTANVIPIPAAVWLFGSGLGLLGWFRRRQSA
jgi:hypothetical protein